MEIVLKNTKIFNDDLYLLIIYKKEVVIGEPGHYSHETYEEYDINYIVELKKLNKVKSDNQKDLKDISLSFREVECEQYFKQKSSEDIA
jgi:hypothetical protein